MFQAVHPGPGVVFSNLLEHSFQWLLWMVQDYYEFLQAEYWLSLEQTEQCFLELLLGQADSHRFGAIIFNILSSLSDTRLASYLSQLRIDLCLLFRLLLWISEVHEDGSLVDWVGILSIYLKH